MSQRRISRSQIETIIPNPIRNGDIDHARLGTSFTGVNNTVTGVSPNFLGTEYIERFYLHAKGGASFSVTQTVPELNSRLDHQNEIGNFHHAMRYEVTTADPILGPDDYYLIEGYIDGGDIRAMNIGGGNSDPNFIGSNPQENDMSGAMMFSWWMRTNYNPGKLFHFSIIDEYNGQSFVSQASIQAPTGNFSAPFQWFKRTAHWRSVPILDGPVSGPAPAIPGGTNSLPTLAGGKRILRWGIGLTGGTNLRLADQLEETKWGGPSAIDARFLSSTHTGPLGTPIDDFQATVGNFVEITKPYLEAGVGHSRIADNPFGLEKELCSRYFQTSYQDGVFPGTAAAAGGRIRTSSNGHNNSVYDIEHYVRLSPEMVNVPTITVYSPVTGTANRVRIGGVDVTPNSIEVFKDGFIVNASGAISTSRDIEFHFVARADLT